MARAQRIVTVVGRVTGRVRMWRLIEALVRSTTWVVIPALVLYIINLIWTLPLAVMVAPAAALGIVFVVLAARSLLQVSRYEVAKIIDDQMGLKDRMTSALYFERLGLTGGLADAAVEDAAAVAARVDTSRITLGTWPRHTLPVAVLVLLTVVVALGPVNIAHWFTRERTTTLVGGPSPEMKDPDAASGVPVAEAPKNLPPAQRRETLEQMKKLESEIPPERDPDSRDLEMNPDLEDDIEAIKAAISLQDMKELEESFKDEEKKDSAGEREERPPKIAPLDKELLDDIVRSKKEKVKKGEGSKDDAIGVAVKMPAPPGARQKGPSTKGRGGHGGGDVGESGDTKGPPRRAEHITGRDPLIIDSRRSADIIEKTDLEKVVMNELMMRLSMDESPEIASPTSVPPSFTEQKREPVVEETVPLGLRGYVQRYFEGLGAE